MSPTALLPFVLALFVASSAPAGAQGVVLAEKADEYRLWRVDEATLEGSLELDVVKFLSLSLPGYAVKDRLRNHLPSLRGDGNKEGKSQHIRLPGDGSLYRIRHEDATKLLLVSSTGALSIVHALANVQGKAALLEGVHVSANGTWALAASSTQSGGDVFVIDLTGQLPVRNVTSSLPTLQIDSTSLRISESTAWFVANGVLHRTDVSGGQAVAHPLPLTGSEWIVPELALSDNGERVAVVAEETAQARRIFVASNDGTSYLATPQPGPYDAPNYDRPLGPWLDLSPAGTRVAFRTSGLEQELFVQTVQSAEPPAHITSEPAYPEYLDNVGPIVFVAELVLCYFVGDSTLSKGDGYEWLGAAEMYVTDFSVAGSLSHRNVTRTSGSSFPPFEQPGTLLFREAVQDPRSRGFLLVGEDEQGETSLSHFLARTELGAHSAVELLFDGREESVELFPAGSDVLIVSERNEKPELHQLRAPEVGNPELRWLASFDDEAEIRGLAADRLGQTAAFIVETEENDEETERAYFIVLASGQITPVAHVPPTTMLALSPAQTFSSSGVLFLGLGTEEDGPYSFAAFAPPGLRWRSSDNSAPVQLPPIEGFPLEP